MDRPLPSSDATPAGVVEDKPGDRTTPPPAPDDFGDAVETSNGRTLLFRKTRTGIAACALLFLLIMGLFYFYGLSSSVPHYVVTRGSLVVEMTGPGILDATNKVTITSRMAGFLNSILVDRNDLVTVGQIVAQLDAGDVQNQLEAARADAEAATSAVSEARSNQAKAQAALDKANSDLARRRNLLQSGTVSQVEIDALEITRRQAQAEYDRLTAVTERARAQARGAAAQVEVLEFKRAEAEIRSPLNGVVVSRDRSVGDLLTAGVQLFQLVDPKSIIISTRLDESSLGLIEPDQKVTLRFTSDPIRFINAKVLRVSRSVDPETREFMIDVVPEELPRNWALGQRAQVAIHVPLPPDTVAIPLEFVSHRNGRSGAWRQVGGRGLWEPIEPGTVSGVYLQVLGGLSSGDLILHPKGRYTFEAVRIKESQQ